MFRTQLFIAALVMVGALLVSAPKGSAQSPTLQIITLPAGFDNAMRKRIRAAAAATGPFITQTEALKRVSQGGQRRAVMLCLDPRVRQIKPNTRCYFLTRSQLNRLMRDVNR